MDRIKTEEDKKKQRVCYEIECDLNLQTKPYADISSPKFGPHPEEEEVLFMVGTIFKFKKMFYNETLRCWIIKLQLFDENKYHSSKLYKSLRDEMGEVTDLLTLGALLVRAGEFEHALRIYLRSFFDTISFDGYLTEDGAHILTQSLMGFASVQCELGRYDLSIDIFNRTIEVINTHKNLHERKYHKAMAYYSISLPLSEKGQYFDALKQCKIARKIFTKHHGYYDLNVANCYEMMGNIYGNLARLEKTKGNINKHYQYFQMAYHYYNKALDIRKKVHEDIPDHYEINATYLNIGELYRDIGQSDQALEYTMKGHDSFVKTFPKSHYWIAIALDNIGEIFVQQQRFNEAKIIYGEAIKIYRKTLPSDHRYIGETLHNLGKLYCCIHMFDEALHYFNQAKEIYKKKIPSYHYLASELRQQINYVTSQLH
jgi:tetratricopeptide (TPR) repeat protein